MCVGNLLPETSRAIYLLTMGREMSILQVTTAKLFIQGAEYISKEWC